MEFSLLPAALAIVYIVLKIVLEKRLAPLDTVGLDQSLSELAYSWGCSTYEVFRRAGAKWNFSGQKIDADFRSYLSEGVMPPYVIDLVELESRTNKHSYHRLLYNGGRPPYL